MPSTPVGVVLRHIRKLAAANGTSRLSDQQLLQRFAGDHDEAAFASLVERHGTMVLSVCRRVLHHLHDAEDAFQATFLILARKAGSIRRHGSVAGWLYQVAYHLAVKARASAAKRRSHLPREVDMPRADPIADLNGQELRLLLDEELHRLPDECRSALVLCYLEGKTQEEAAGLLGWSKGTLRRRLGQGRELLRIRLVRRGLSLSAALIATFLAQSAARATVRAALADTTVRAAVGLAAGQAVAGLVSAPVAALVEGGLQTMFMNKVKVATAILVAVCIVSGAGVAAHRSLAAKEAAAPPAAAKKNVKPRPADKETAEPQAAEAGDTYEVSGQVVDPDGKPVAGARVYLAHHLYANPELAPGFSRVQAATGDDGRFQFRATRPLFGQPEEDKAWFNATITAVSAGFGPGFATAYESKQLAGLTLKLVKDDVPINGRIVDLEGKPIQGVTVRVLHVTPMAKESLQPWLDELKKKNDRYVISRHRSTGLDAATAGLKQSITTGADGKFRLAGIGRERIAALRIEGPTIETVDLYAMTRSGPTITIAPHKDVPADMRNLIYRGARFDHAAAPTMPIVGTLRDKDTGKPLAGVTVQSRIPSTDRDYLRTATDMDGRYRLVGLPRQAGHAIEIIPPAGKPYLTSAKTTSTSAGLDPLKMDFDLKRGVLIRGRVTDKATGKPVPRAQVDYFVFVTNPHLREVPGFRGSGHVQTFTAEDGAFTLVGLPGPGIVAAKAGRLHHYTPEDGRYVAGSGADEIKGPRDGSHFTTDPFICAAPLYHTLVGINPDKNAESITVNVLLDPGKTVTGKVVGPDGKPVAGVRMSSTWGLSNRQQDLKTAEFTVRAIDPKHPQPFFFHHKDKPLGAAVLLKGDEPKDFTVRLQPCATLTGRLLDDDGQPRAGVSISGTIEAGQLNIVEGWGGFFNGTTDKEGHFEIKGLMPGLKLSAFTQQGARYTGRLFQQLTFKPGEKKDLGDVKADTSGF